MIDLSLLDQDDPFEIDDDNRPHLAKHSYLSEEDAYDVFLSDPIFLPAHPPAELLMVGSANGEIYVVPILEARMRHQVRPIGIYLAGKVAKEAYLNG